MDELPTYASLNVTIAGQNGDLPDQVLFDLSDEAVRAIATEAVRSGGIRGVDAHATADFTDFVVDRVAAHDGLPHRLLLRPKTPFGADESNVEGFRHPNLSSTQEGILHLAAKCLVAIPSDYLGFRYTPSEIAKMATDLAMALKAEVKNRSIP